MKINNSSSVTHVHSGTNEEPRKENAELAQAGLDESKHILAFMENGIHKAMTTRSYDEWGMVIDAVLKCQKQLNDAVQDMLDGVLEYSHCSSYNTGMTVSRTTEADHLEVMSPVQ